MEEDQVTEEFEECLRHAIETIAGIEHAVICLSEDYCFSCNVAAVRTHFLPCHQFMYENRLSIFSAHMSQIPYCLVNLRVILNRHQAPEPYRKPLCMYAYPAASKKHKCPDMQP